MTGAHASWRLLAVGAALAVLAALVETGARFSLTSSATPRRSLGLWIASMAVLLLALPSAAVTLRAGFTGPQRRSIAAAFVAFDVLGALVIWRTSQSGNAFGTPVVLVASWLAVLLLVAAASWCYLGRDAPAVSTEGHR